MFKEKLNHIFFLYRNMSLPLKISFWFFFCSLLQKGISFLTTPIFTRILSTENYGIVSVYNSWEQIIIIFVTFSLSNSVFNVGLVKFPDHKDEYQTSLLGLSSTCAVVFSIIFLSTYGFFETWFQLEYKFVIVMVIYCIFKSTISMWSLRERFEYRYKSMLKVTILNTILGTIMSVLLVFNFQDKAFAKIFGLALVTIVIGVFCYADTIKKSKCFYNLEYWRFAIKYNLPMIPHFLSTVFLNQLDRIMIKSMCNTSQAGIYSVGYNSAGFVVIINQALSAAYNPWLLQKLKKKEYGGIKELVNLILASYLSILVLIILFAPEIIKIMATKDYYEGIYVIPPVACSMFFILLFNMFAPVEYFSLKTKFIAVASTSAAVVNVVLNYVCISIFGYLSAGYTTLVCYMIYAFAHFVYMKKVCNTNMSGIVIFDDKRIVFMSGLVVIISIISTVLYSYSYVRYLIIILIGVILFANKDKIVSAFLVFKKMD